MKPWGLPLWDLLKRRGKPPAPAPGSRPPRPAQDAGRAAARARPANMADRYDAMVRRMLEAHGVRVRKWRTAMSGVAWELKSDDGSVRRLIESPRPRGPMSAAIFLHEIGHHAIGFNRYKPRCLEEYHAWMFALGQMEDLGLNITAAVRRRVHASLHYAIRKAQRRGLVSLPTELEPYLAPPPRRARRVGAATRSVEPKAPHRPRRRAGSRGKA